MSKRSRARNAIVVRERNAVMQQKAPGGLASVDGERGWMTIWNSAQPEYAFQRDHPPNHWTLQRNWTVFACQTLIAADMGKMAIRLMEWSAKDLIYREVESPAVSPVLLKPNHYQTWPKFVQQWILSKVGNGNAYMLKERDARNVVVKLYVLDPYRVTPLVAPDGSVYYRLYADDLAGIPDKEVVVPASEIMHDRMWCLFHPLVGLSPLFASWLAAVQGLTIQEQSKRFFANSSRPGGMLVSPQPISDQLAKDYKKRWEENYAGGNEGRTAVLGNGLKYEPLSQNAVDSELVAQLNLTAAMICSTYHVPGYKVGVGAMPTYQNAEVLNQIYYSDCLQTLVQDAETLLDEGLELPQKGYNAQFNIDDLLRMDSATQMAFVSKGIEKAVFSPNEGRRRFNMPPVKGGEKPLLQQQNWPIDVLADRPPPTNPAAKAPAPNVPQPDPAAAANDAAAKFATTLTRRFLEAANA